MAGKIKSFAWLFFDKLSPTVVQCKLCRQQFGFSSSTSSMRKHIQYRHPEQESLISNHIRQSFHGKDALLEKAVKRYFKQNGTLNYYCTLCQVPFKKVKDTVYLMQHILFKHSVILRGFEASMASTINTDFLTSSSENELNDEEDQIQPDLYEDYITGIETRSSKKSHRQKSASANRKQSGLENGGVQKEQLTPVQPGFKGKTTSIVWKFMTKVSPIEVVCQLCSQSFAFTGSTTTMRAHLKRNHPQELELVFAEQSIATVNTDISINENDVVLQVGEDQMQSDSDEDFIPQSATRSPKGGQGQKSVKRKQGGLGNGGVQKEQLTAVRRSSKGHTTSIVWNFVTKVSPVEVVCQLCSQSFVFSGSTTSIKAHIKKKHPQELEMAEHGETLDIPTITVGPAVREMKQEIVPETETYQLSEIAEEIFNQEETSQGNTCIEEIGPFFKKRPLSIVWKFMDRVGEAKAVCRLCKRSIKFCSSSTTSMYKHLTTWHPLELARMKALPRYKQTKSNRVKVEPSVREVNLSRPKLPVPHLDILANMVVNNMCPASIVEKESFKRFALSLNPKFLVPDTAMLEQTILKLYKKQRDLLEKELEEAAGVSISIEVWTYRERQQYMTVSGHFVSDTWDIQSAILKTVLLDSRVDLSASIATKLEQIFREWKIFDKIKCIVINGTECLRGAINQINKPYVYCMAFVLNTTVLEALQASNDITYLAKRVRDVVSFFHHSEEASEKLRKVQMSGGKTPKKLVQDAELDWVSTYKMFKGYLELLPDIAPSIDNVTVENILLVAEELELLKGCVQVLEPFALAAQDLTSDTFTNLSKALPVLCIIKQMVSNLSTDGGDAEVIEYSSAVAFTRDLYNRLEKWMNVIRDRQQITPWAATLLDPRFKHTVMEHPDMLQLVQAQLQKLMDPNGNTDGNEVEAVSKVGEAVAVDTNDISLLWSSFDETIKKYVTEEPVDELQRYIDERSITRQEDPFRWWMERDHLYPKLCTVVKQFLNIPATSVPPTQVFSAAEKRNISLRNFIEEPQLDSVLFLGTSHILSYS